MNALTYWRLFLNAFVSQARMNDRMTRAFAHTTRHCATCCMAKNPQSSRARNGTYLKYVCEIL